MDLTTDTGKNAYLHNLYFGPEHRAQGRDSLFQYISKQEGIKTISRRFIAKFLAANTTQQLFTAKKKTTSIRPILASKISIFQIDLIDFQKKPSVGNYRYVFNCIDIVSRKCWLVPLKTKTNVAVNRALKVVIDDIQKNYTVKAIMSDRGNEFKNIDEVFPDNVIPIKHVESRAYTAASNSVIERSNKTVKALLWRILYSDHSKDWRKYLPVIEETYNTSLNRMTGKTPDEVYFNTTAQEKKELYDTQLAKKRMGYKEILTVLKVGDHVRLVTPKEKYKTKGKPLWSTEIYTIVKVIPANKLKTTIPRYKIADSKGVLEHNTLPLSKLLFIPPN
jgi:hypothetical protein